MKKYSFRPSLSLVAFSSFRGPGNPVSFRMEETFSTSFGAAYCNGDLIQLDDAAVQMNYHGVINKKRTLLTGSTTITGTGTNTAEVFTIHDKTFQTNHFSIGAEEGSFSYRQRIRLTGSEGTVLNLILKEHTTLNARGELAAFRSF